MVVVYAVAVVVGSCALIGWLVAQARAEAPDSRWAGPDERFGVGGRRAVMAAVGFGLGGMSASFAGWPAALAFGAALAGAAGLVAGVWLLADDRS